MNRELLYDYVDVLENEMADVMDADAERYIVQSSEAQAGRAVAFLVTEVDEFVRNGKPIPWVKIAAYALAVAGQQAIAEAPEPGADEIPF